MYKRQSWDGACIGLPDAPQTWHVIEMKTHGKKSFDELTAKGVQTAKPEHYAQMQCYMAWSGMTRALYMAVCKDDDRMHLERIDYDREAADRLFVKAQRIIDAPEPLPGISNGGPAEMNPFLGVRGLRLSLAHPDPFRTQPRALLRAATAGHIWTLFPIVATVGDVHAARRFVDDVAALPLPAGELSLSASLFGSLAYTGEGHGTFRAVLCGLMGMAPESYDRGEADEALAALAHTQRVRAVPYTQLKPPTVHPV